MKRPDHPDLRRMSHLIRRLDHLADIGDTNPLHRVLRELELDEHSTAYMAVQRGYRAVRHANSPLDVGTTASAWIDGFILGLAYNQRRYDTDGWEGGLDQLLPEDPGPTEEEV